MPKDGSSEKSTPQQASQAPNLAADEEMINQFEVTRDLQNLDNHEPVSAAVSAGNTSGLISDRQKQMNFNLTRELCKINKKKLSIDKKKKMIKACNSCTDHDMPLPVLPK